MKILRFFLLTIMILIISVGANALEPPKIVINGYKAYKKEGFEKALSIWMKGSPLENDKTSLMDMKGVITQVESIYGKMISYEIIKTIKITSSLNRVYAEICYEKGPVFMFIDCYKSPNGWIIPLIRFHTEPDKILPNDFLNE